MSQLPRALKAKIKGMQIKDKAMSKVLYPYDTVAGDLKLYVLRQNGRDRKFDILAIIDYWGVKFDNYLNQHIFSVSTIDENFGEFENETFFEVTRKATHVAKKGELYSIKDGATVQVFKSESGYKINGEIQGEKFALSDTEP
mgnify:CR=1 FL=1